MGMKLRGNKITRTVNQKKKTFEGMSHDFSVATKISKCEIAHPKLRNPLPFFVLASLFGSLLIRPPPKLAGRQTQQDRQKVMDFVLGFLMAGDEE